MYKLPSCMHLLNYIITYCWTYEGRLKSSDHWGISLKRVIKTIIKYIFSKRSILCRQFVIVNYKIEELHNVTNWS